MCAYIYDFKTATLPEIKNNKETILQGRVIEVDTSSYNGVKRLKDIFIIKVHHRSVSLDCTVYWGPFTG